MAPELKYRRVLLKLSGEALAGAQGFGIEPSVVDRLADQVKAVHEMGVSLGLVIGGGNIVRGSLASQKGMDRVQADYMGMLATVINALAVQDLLDRKGVATRVMTAIRMEQLAEPYIRRRALRHMEKGRLVIFAGGSGNPYFSTDTAAVLRAIEMSADLLIKATKVGGVYSADPATTPRQSSFRPLPFKRLSRGNLASWTLLPSHSAKRTTCRSSFSTSRIERPCPRPFGVSRWAPWSPDAPTEAARPTGPGKTHGTRCLCR